MIVVADLPYRLRRVLELRGLGWSPFEIAVFYGATEDEIRGLERDARARLAGDDAAVIA